MLWTCKSFHAHAFKNPCVCMQELMEVKGIELLDLELGAAAPGGYWEPYLGPLREHYMLIATSHLSSHQKAETVSISFFS